MANFTLTDVDGKPVSLYGFAGKPGAVLVFTGTECPLGNLYLPRLNELARIYESKGIVFLAINSNASETVEKVADHARSHGITFPVLKDKNNVVADLAQAERTCEVVVLDSVAVIRYRGAIDDQYSVGGARKPAPTKNYLADAIDAVLDRRPVAVASTPVEGCPIERVELQVHGDDESPTRRARDRRGAQRSGQSGRADPGRAGDLCFRRGADRPGKVPVVPPAGPGRAVLAPELRRRPSVVELDFRGRRGSTDAPLACRPPLRSFLQ